MKRHAILGAIVLVAALAMAGCNNEKKQKEAESTNRMLLIVDPQIDFTTGSLATANGPAAMDILAKAINDSIWKNYSWIIVTQDAHPESHCSFVANGGVFPPHCVENTEGMNVYPALQEALNKVYNKDLHYMYKGDLPEKEEFSIFQNERSGEKLRSIIEQEQFESIDVCGIATDYCVYETVKDLLLFWPPNQLRIVTNCLAAVDDNDTKLAYVMKELNIEGIEF